MDECPEGNHLGNMKLDCGNNFHCPLIFTITTAETLLLPLIGRVVITPSLLKIDELITLIFRPPKQDIQNSISWGQRVFINDVNLA